MNDVTLKGIIHNIESSHSIKTTEFDKAILEVEDENGEPNFIAIKFKKQYNNYGEGDKVALRGNMRSYSYKQDDKNKVSIYVFTYFDTPDTEYNNHFEIDGRVCKINKLYTTKNGNYSLQFILANNIYDESRGLKFNSYLPVVCWGDEAVRLANELQVNDQVVVKGKIHSRKYTKTIGDEAQTFDVQELIAESVQKN